MDLFVINRYDNEEEKESNQSYDHLSQLLQKIEERKKLREKCDSGDDKQPQDVQNKGDHDALFPKSHKKSRKRKKEIQKSVDEPTDLGQEKSETLPPENEKLKDLNQDEKLKDLNQENFMVLGSLSHKKKKEVKRVLPKWLAHPEIISSDLGNGPKLKEISGKLDDHLIGILKSNGINKLFPVQEKMMNWMVKCSEDRMKGWWVRDTCVSAPTGSGKTLAYVLPIIQHLKHHFVREVRCLVVLPVQELAAQIYKVMTTYAAHTNLKVGLISGASSMDIEQKILLKKSQRGQFYSRVDIIVATPGRLIDHIEKTEGFSLQNLEFLVIDEADRATDWLKYIPEYHRNAHLLTIKNLNARPILPAQKLLFSATLSQDPEKLSRLGLFQPILFTSVSMMNQTDEDVDLDKQMDKFIGKYTSPHELIERAFESPPEYKPVLLCQLITSQDPVEKTLIFTNSGESAHRLAILLTSFLEELKLNIQVDELSTQLLPKQRFQVLKKFISGESKILVSSDALARGLDIPEVKLVVSYDLPKSIKGYIHRVGRTGRAGVSGTAVSILTPNQIVPFNRMLSSAHKVVPTIEHLESVESIADKINYQSHLDKLKRTIEDEQTKEMEKIRLAKRRRLINNKSSKKKIKASN